MQRVLVVLGALLAVAGVALGQLHLLGTTAGFLLLVVGASLLVAGVIKRHTRPGDFNRSGWTGF